jgi:Asp-tRNA(Asn)/Glu-tRNA(Gln) amidotransferase A subunit family amidase
MLIKDNIDSGDKMMTTAGALALEGNIAAQDAFIVARLREAGAVLLGKTNLSEWANIRDTHSTSGWSARGGLTRNPYALDRNPSGSSSGSAVAVAAGLVPFSVGTDTAGSGRVPAALCGIVGLKPSLGLVSTLGMVPACASLDCPSVFATSVADAAAVLAVIAAHEPADPWSRRLPVPGPLPRTAPPERAWPGQAPPGDARAGECGATATLDEKPAPAPARDGAPELATHPENRADPGSRADRGNGADPGNGGDPAKGTAPALPKAAARAGSGTWADAFARADAAAPADAGAQADPGAWLPRFGVPRDPEFYGDDAAAAAFAQVIELIGRAGEAGGLAPDGAVRGPADASGQAGEQPLTVDTADFLAAGRLLYQGPWVAERLAAVGDFAAAHPDQVHPVTRAVLDSGRGFSAADAFRGMHRLAELRAATRAVWESVDVLLVPTVPTTFTVEEMLADPVRRNSVLGHYTTFCNLLDLCAVAIPAGFTAAGRPHGVTLLAPGGSDALLARTAARLEPVLGAQRPR